MGKEAKSGKAGRNKGDDTAKRRRTKHHKEVRAKRYDVERGKQKLGRDKRFEGLSTVAQKLGARISIRGTPSRAKRDLIDFITAPIENARQQRVLRLRYGRMTIQQFTTYLIAKMGG